MTPVTIMAREMRFENDQALEMFPVPFVMVLAQEMRLKFFEVAKLWSR